MASRLKLGGRDGCVPAVLCAAALGAGALAQAPAGEDVKEASMRVTVRMDRGEDLGQSFGSLFELGTADGKLVVGAGFQDVFNTHLRCDRHTVHFFVRPTDGARQYDCQPLPRPGPDAGAYLFDVADTLYFRGGTIRRWDEEAQQWRDDPNRFSGRTRLGRGMLAFATNHVEYDGRRILRGPEKGDFYRFYYAHGHLFFYHTWWAGKRDGYRLYEADDKGFSKLYACPWTPAEASVDLGRATVLTLPVLGETPFAYGQLGKEVLTCSNIGGLYVFDGQAWKTLVEPKLKTSYQIYTMVNFYDKLLMGQYPSGRLFVYDGEQVTHPPDWPPRLEGVSKSAREAQTAAIYGGDLFVGVWPWGELWRLNHDTGAWSFVRRMFPHPPITDKTTHPYEKECIALKLVTNQWGQRVTSLTPLADSLIVSTSAKWPCKWEPRFEFVPDGKWQDYGRVYRLKAPGNLCAATAWTDGPTELQFSTNGRELRISQDGKPLASAPLDESLAAGLAAGGVGKITWGAGAFGAFGGTSLTGQVTPPPVKPASK